MLIYDIKYYATLEKNVQISLKINKSKITINT